MSSDWRPGASLEVLRLRAQMLAVVRAFFAERGVLEVEVPCLAGAGVADPWIVNPAVSLNGPEGPRTLYLQSSPEYAMKRLVCAGSGPIYAVSRCFRDGEEGALHNPEFTMVEWYRPGLDLAELCDEVSALLARLLSPDALQDGGADAAHADVRDYGEAFIGATGLDPMTAPDAALRVACADADARGWSRDECLDWLFASRVQPALARSCRGSSEQSVVHVRDFPASQSALARMDRETGRALRFETFVNGIEVANGYDELRDAAELARRDAVYRDTAARAGRPAMPSDERLLDAMRHGLPQCCGVALGFDRVVLLRQGADRLDDVMAFTTSRA